MEFVRPSILHRPTKASSNCTVESADEQWRKEQELLAARSRRLHNAETRLLNALYPSAEHVQARQAEVLQLQEQHMAAKAEAKKREAQLEAQISQQARSSSTLNQQMQLQPQEADPVRPWATATLGYATVDDEKEARKHFAAQTAAGNLALMAERAAQRKQLQQEQQLLDRQVVTSETEYWNLGASSRKWIAPEHRHLAPPSPAAQSAAAAAAAAAETAAAGRAAATYAAPPWATYSPLVPAAVPASAPLAAMPAMPAPWATHTRAATTQPWVTKAGTLAPPWATYSSQPTPQPMRSMRSSVAAGEDMRQRPGSNAGSTHGGGGRDGGGMRPQTAGSCEHNASHSRPTSCKPQQVRKYPWEWHE